MVRPAKTVLLVLLSAALCLAASPVNAATSQKARARAKSAKPKVEVPAPAPAPAPPPTPGQLPPSPPQVSFRDGLLTVNAQNSTLADILAAVRTQTGATIEMPSGSGRERVFFRQGPAPPRDVLASLLKGSSFDYIILGPPDRPGDVQRVLLMVKPTGAESASAQTAPAPQMPVRNADPDLDEGTDEGPAPEEAQPQPYQPPPQPEPVQPTPNQPKTPEQLLQELRQQQQRLQQQQQQQQQQNPPPQSPDDPQ